MATIKGIDVSHYQGRIDWAKVKADGVKFAIAKCTQGLTYKDPTYEANKKGARENGILFGSYHYANATNAVLEADWFIKNAGDIREGELLVLDWEKTTIANPQMWCKNFLDRVRKNTGVKPYFYSYQAIVLSKDWSIVSGDYPLWEARYSNPDLGLVGKEPLTGTWTDWQIFQYSSKGHINGISGNVDLNIMKTGDNNSDNNNNGDNNMEFKPGELIILSQQDPHWGFKPIGNSAYLIKDWGCVVTSISIASSWFGCYQNPGQIAKNLNFTADARILWQSISLKTCFQFEWRFYKHDAILIGDALKDPRKVCLLNVYGRHWVLALRKLPGGYWVADPWLGNKKFYLTSAVSGGAILKI